MAIALGLQCNLCGLLLLANGADGAETGVCADWPDQLARSDGCVGVGLSRPPRGWLDCHPDPAGLVPRGPVLPVERGAAAAARACRSGRRFFARPACRPLPPVQRGNSRTKPSVSGILIEALMPELRDGMTGRRICQASSLHVLPKQQCQNQYSQCRGTVVP